MHSMHTASVAIIGASGYSGIEATRILAHHPRVELRLLASDRWSGDTLARRVGLSGSTGAALALLAVKQPAAAHGVRWTSFPS